MIRQSIYSKSRSQSRGRITGINGWGSGPGKWKFWLSKQVCTLGEEACDYVPVSVCDCVWVCVCVCVWVCVCVCAFTCVPFKKVSEYSETDFFVSPVTESFKIQQTIWRGFRCFHSPAFWWKLKSVLVCARNCSKKAGKRMVLGSMPSCIRAQNSDYLKNVGWKKQSESKQITEKYLG
jgi:hypothetical protein